MTSTILKASVDQPVQDTILVVLAAGAVTQDFVSVVNTSTPAMLPYMGRPLIYQTIVNHIKRYGRNVIIAVPDNEPRLVDFLRVTFGARVNLVLVEITPSDTDTPVTSLNAALNAAAAQGLQDAPVFILHGDIYFETPELGTHSAPVAFVDDHIDSDKYSLFTSENGLLRFHEAGNAALKAMAEIPETYTDIGAYWVPSMQTIREAVSTSSERTVGGLLAALYGDELTVAKVSNWSDLGHLDTATQIRTRLIGAREFNSLSIDEDRGLITKRSAKNIKILQELNYYLHLPENLRIYFPRLHDFNVGRDISYTLEYYSYRTLAEYLVFFNFPSSIWQKILKRVLAIHSEFRSHAGVTADAEAFKGFYLGKLLSRMDLLVESSAVAHLTNAASVEVNGRSYAGWKTYVSRIEAALERMSLSADTSIIHGDLCFSNVLYDPQTGLIKLIDPRGDFFTEGCYGDPRYDLAKLLHSFHGGYDFIVQEMFELRELGPDEFSFRLFRPAVAETIAVDLVDWMGQVEGNDINDLLLLEALLFLSMLPLHSDDEQRQKALYLTGIRILAEVFDADLR